MYGSCYLQIAGAERSSDPFFCLHIRIRYPPLDRVPSWALRMTLGPWCNLWVGLYGGYDSISLLDWFSSISAFSSATDHTHTHTHTHTHLALSITLFSGHLTPFSIPPTHWSALQTRGILYSSSRGWENVYSHNLGTESDLGKISSGILPACPSLQSLWVHSAAGTTLSLVWRCLWGISFPSSTC